MSNILYIKNIPKGVCCSDLFDELTKGNDSGVIQVYKKENRNYAYVELNSIESAENLKKKFANNYKIYF